MDMQRKLSVSIAVRAALLERVDELRRAKSQNRSEFLSELLERFLPTVEREIATADQNEALEILGRRAKPRKAKTG